MHYDEDDDDDGEWEIRRSGQSLFNFNKNPSESLYYGIIPGYTVNNIRSDYYTSEALMCFYGKGGIYRTLTRWDVPYTGWYKICINTGKGQDTSIGCYMHSGVKGSYGSYLQGEVYLEQGDVLLMLIGSIPDRGSESGPQSDESGDTNVDGYAAGSTFIMKYKDSTNMQWVWDWFHRNNIDEGQGIVWGTNDVVCYYDNDDRKLYLPNSELLMICGGGNGSSSYCTHTGRDSESSGYESGFWWNANYVRNVAGVHGKYYKDETHWQDPSTISGGFVSSDTYNRITYEGYYKPGISTGTLSLLDAMKDSGGNDVNDSWVKIVLNGAYVHYHSNYPSGVTGSGTMLSTRISAGLTGVLRNNTFNAGDDWVFQGWSTSAERANKGTVDYLNQATIGPISNDVDLYAVWKPAAYYITYDKNSPNGNTVYGTMEPKEVENGLGSYLDENKYSCQGYIWKGWGSSSGTTTVVWQDKGWVSPREDDITVYAVWEPIVYNVNIFNNKPADSTSNIVQIK